MRFTGKSVLVTGATRGIGAACARAFLAEGARVAINGRTDTSVAVAMARYEGNANAIPAPGDVATVAGCDAAVAAALAAFGGLDILVNNAGVFFRGTIEDTDEKAWDAVMNANVKSVQFCTRAALPALRVARGTIVNIASESGLNGYPGTTAYCASKGAVVNLTRSMAMELAPDVRVNALCPGVVETDMARAGFAIDGDEDAGMREQADAYPLKRIGTVAETAAAVLFLASHEAGFINGVALPMEGGATAGQW
ncbi:SDR family NAD(P)-dependent oxidoreductase [Microbaculum marinisediminis]|uniref:SDR family oxidoreductase n=1 Tax=Microbaculum marinisediminis TaxID=2931392 RepID=A0AAW5QZK9_9HYPH|nr:SDR family oxidoreductase [Microbaculum sp. A6E488]MCT8971705.1 SDR family oxidoreductase [Microbaculum sp. A6E488]